MNNCNEHGNIETLPDPTQVEIEFLPPYIESIPQPLDAEIIAAIKVNHKRWRVEHAVDLFDIGEMDILQN